MPLERNIHAMTSQSAFTPLSIDAYVGLYHELLASPGKIVIDDLEMAHRRIDSSLHHSSASGTVNPAAFVYAAARLPRCLPRVNRIIVAPTEKVFMECGYGHVLDWARVDAQRRRRRAHYDGNRILALFIVSISDFDEIVPALCAYQIEWNTMHSRLSTSGAGRAIAEGRLRASDAADEICRLFAVNKKDWQLFFNLWTTELDSQLRAIATAPKKLTVERLPLHPGDFEHTAATWLDATIDHFSDIDFEGRPVYIVSSNNHGIANLVSGYSRRNRSGIIADTRDDIIDDDSERLGDYWKKLEHEEESLRMDFLYYALRSYLEKHPEHLEEKLRDEEAAGVRRFIPDHFLHLEAQIIEIDKLDPERLDPGLSASRSIAERGNRLRTQKPAPKDKPLIFNIDYPFGHSAYHLMTLMLSRFKRVRGVFILGKSAAMIGRLGDIMIPGEVHDVHSGAVYRFRNHFTAGKIVHYLARTAVFDEQRALTVRGTFLHSRHSMADFRGVDFTGIEMEAGPYLSAIADSLQNVAGSVPPLKRNAFIDVAPPFSIGILHYTSDTPYNQRASLLSRRMGLKGLEATYACCRAILDAITA